MSALKLAQAVAWALAVQALLLLTVLILQAGPTTPSLIVISTKSEWAGLVANRINTTPGHPVRAFVGTTASDAKDDLLADRTQAVLLIDPTRPTDELTVSSAQGSDTAAIIEAVVGSVEQSENRRVTRYDLTERPVGDPTGRHAHHLLLAWLVSGLTLGVLTNRFRRSGLSGEATVSAVLLACAALLSAMSIGIVALVVPAWAARAPSMCALGVVVITAAALSARAASRTARQAPLVVVSAAILIVAADPVATGADGFGRAGAIWAPVAPLTLPGAAMSALRRLAQLDLGVTSAQWVILAWWCAAGLLAAVVTNAGTTESQRSRG